MDVLVLLVFLVFWGATWGLIHMFGLLMGAVK
jgi:hypothetical protein